MRFQSFKTRTRTSDAMAKHALAGLKEARLSFLRDARKAEREGLPYTGAKARAEARKLRDAIDSLAGVLPVWKA